MTLNLLSPTSNHNMLDVAFCCGLRSQAHFTTVFKRLVGATPKHWQTTTLEAFRADRSHAFVR